MRLALAILAVAPLHATLHLPSILSDHMVLQQEKPVRIWGKASPGEKVTVRFRGQVVEGTADASGRWATWLKPMRPGRPSELTVSAGETLHIEDVLVGEVWVGSGQSNMHFPMSRLANAKEEIAAADYPEMRFFDVEFTIAEEPRDDVKGKWFVSRPEAISSESAVGYFFARDLHRRLKVPVGFIHASWGGSSIQSWLSKETLQGDPNFAFIYEGWQKILDAFPEANEKYKKGLMKTPPHGPGTHLTPSCLYNGMILPIAPFAIRGVTWYQGETNGSGYYAWAYRYVFRTMIEEWRRTWGEGDFPFLFVQLANLDAKNDWPVLRESQTLALELRNTAMAVTIDIGNSQDIHPTNKQEVGRRLALAARALAYGETIEYSGPLYRQMTVEGNAARLWFDHVGRGLVLKGEKGFEMSAENGRFVPAVAKVDGDTVVVTSPEVTRPTAIRYGWTSDPPATLFNENDLPASPFRTRMEQEKR